MSHYKPYPQYRDSGVEWLGMLPTHWIVGPLKYFADLDGGAGFPEEEQGVENAPIPFFKVADLANGMTSAENFVTDETAARLRAKVFPEGTIAFAKVGAALLLNRRVSMPLSGCVDNNMMVALPRRIRGSWLLDILRAFDMGALVNPGAVPSINQEQVGNIMLPIPTDDEQVFITTFLDRETARIDALVDKKIRFIELLREKRQALITHAVTKGLDPNAPIKDSGVEWLGEVPEHWIVKKITYWISSSGSGTTPSSEQEYCEEGGGGIPWVTTGELRENTILSTQRYVTPEAIKNYSSLKVHPIGSLVIAMYGATVGRLAMLGKAASLNQACFAIHPCSSIRLDFLRYWIEGLRAVLMDMATGAGQPNISADKIRNLIVAAPNTLYEQDEIVSFLVRESSLIDELISKSERSIQLLKERRTSLITAAVTGQIDLREVA